MSHFWMKALAAFNDDRLLSCLPYGRSQGKKYYVLSQFPGGTPYNGLYWEAPPQFSLS